MDGKKARDQVEKTDADRRDAIGDQGEVIGCVTAEQIAQWAERMEILRSELRLDEEFAAQGRPYVELDSQGRVVRRDPTSE